jgi:hypothetical protein
MIDIRAWEQANSRYLSTALEWLRGRLIHGPSTDLVSSERVAELTETLEQFNERMSPNQQQENFSPSLTFLSECLGLSDFERCVLLLCAAMEFDPGMSVLCSQSKANLGLPYPTFALALSIFDKPSWDALSPEHPLRYWKLIEITHTTGQALTSSALRADERIVAYLKGLNYLDDRLTAYLTPLGNTSSAGELAPSQKEVATKIAQSWMMRSPDTESRAVVQLCGSDTMSKQAVALYAAATKGLRLYRVSYDALPNQPSDLESFARLWLRESLLLPLALYVDAQEMDSDAHAIALRKFLVRCDGFLLIAVRESMPRLSRASWSIHAGKPTQQEQQQAWQAALGEEESDAGAALASQFSLNLSDIRQTYAMTAQELALNDSMMCALWDACRVRMRPSLDALAQRLDTKATWDDIVLPQDETDLLHQVAAQVNQRNKVYNEWGFDQRMNRGLGISALFAGESGTGKTMAAEVLANDLRLNLYRVDLSVVISKYIGETEKNLRRLFDAAEEGGAIIFFDEADALFGKRSEVKDSHDRYANIEVNYLLQRMESYCGLAILATNMRSVLDNAFTRRLRFIVNFPFPGVADRRRMWRKAFPAQTPLENLDYDRLARINLTGGSVHNAAINAAFLAAQAGTRVTMAMALRAIRGELIKMDRPVNEAEFRWGEAKGAVA